MAAQQFEVFLAKRACAVMVCLSFDALTNCFALRSADRKCAIAFLPFEVAQANLIVHPTRRNALWFAKHISQAMCCAKPDKQMHMIGNAAHTLCDSIRHSNDPAELRVQVIAPGGLDYRLVIFRSKNNVIVQAQMC